MPSKMPGIVVVGDHASMSQAIERILRAGGSRQFPALSRGEEKPAARSPLRARGGGFEGEGTGETCRGFGATTLFKNLLYLPVSWDILEVRALLTCSEENTAMPSTDEIYRKVSTTLVEALNVEE
jgi:hypothetical protein